MWEFLVISGEVQETFPLKGLGMLLSSDSDPVRDPAECELILSRNLARQSRAQLSKVIHEWVVRVSCHRLVGAGCHSRKSSSTILLLLTLNCLRVWTASAESLLCEVNFNMFAFVIGMELPLTCLQASWVMSVAEKERTAGMSCVLACLQNHGSLKVAERPNGEKLGFLDMKKDMAHTFLE